MGRKWDFDQAWCEVCGPLTSVQCSSSSEAAGHHRRTGHYVIAYFSGSQHYGTPATPAPATPGGEQP